MSEVHSIRDDMRVEIDGDTVFVVTLKKNWAYESTVEFLQLLDGVRARHERLFILCDGSRSNIAPEQRIRRSIATWTANNTFSGLALFGVAPLMRPVVTLIFNAANLFRRGSAPVVIVKDEAEARRWIAARRAALDAERR